MFGVFSPRKLIRNFKSFYCRNERIYWSQYHNLKFAIESLLLLFATDNHRIINWYNFGIGKITTVLRLVIFVNVSQAFETKHVKSLDVCYWKPTSKFISIRRLPN